MRVLIAIAVILSFGSASAANLTCDGKVTYVGIHGNGLLYVSYGYAWQSICEVSGSTNVVKAEACRGWVALLLAAQAQGKTIRVYYETTTPGNPTSCTDVQPWTATSPQFIHTLD